MTVLGGVLAVLAMLAGLLHDVTQLATSPSGLTALALGGAAVLAGAALAAAVLALFTSVASLSRTAAALPLTRSAMIRRPTWPSSESIFPDCRPSLWEIRNNCTPARWPSPSAIPTDFSPPSRRV